MPGYLNGTDYWFGKYETTGITTKNIKRKILQQRNEQIASRIDRWENQKQQIIQDKAEKHQERIKILQQLTPKQQKDREVLWSSQDKKQAQKKQKTIAKKINSILKHTENLRTRLSSKIDPFTKEKLQKRLLLLEEQRKYLNQELSSLLQILS